MSTITLDDSPFYGQARSTPVLLPISTCCARCGSSLAKRKVGTREQTVAAVALLVDVYRCRCGRGREVRRPR